ncbi:MAG: hypothetical protein ACYDBH_14135 [Acidobacteriaceae bacterium]
MNNLKKILNRVIRPWLLVAVALGLVPVGALASSYIIQDDFTGSSAQLNWVPAGTLNGVAGNWTPCLTAGNSTGSIPGCNLSTPDPVGSGALRLTNSSTNEAGLIMSNFTYPSTQGIQVIFTTYTYGGNGYTNYNGVKSGADGIGFYLLDGTQAPNVGAFGGSLGYSCSNSNSPYNGMAGAYLGLGIDEYGNFLNQGDNTATGINGHANPGEIGLRGYGNVNMAALQAINPNENNPTDVQTVCKNGGTYTYRLNGEQQTTTLPDYAMIPGAYEILPANEPIFSQENSTSPSRTKATPITYKLIITPTGLLSFWYNYNNTGYQSVITQQSISASNGPMPGSFRFGFGASSGGGSNYHEITCFIATPANSSIGAPVAPLSITSGDFIYMLTSGTDPIAGHADAYTVSANGTPSTTASWDAAAQMTTTNRTNDLWSTASNNSTPILFTSLDSAAFALTATTCVPNTSTIIDYTINPNYPTPSGCPSYLNGRQPGWYLGEFSFADAAALLTPPNNPLDLALPGYVTFSQSESSRPDALLFTNNDGFLYSVNSQTGALNWGWMPRPLVAQLQNYTVVPTDSPGLLDGNFSTVDAVDASGNWATYVIGSAEGGAYWYDLKLTSSGAPGAVIQAPSVPSGATYPQRQAPVVADVPVTTTVNGQSVTQIQQIAAFVANSGSGNSAVSTLYEFNVATGSASSYAFPNGSSGIVGQVSSNLFFDAASQQLYFGDSAGNVYVMPLTDNAKSDVSNIAQLGTTKDGLPVTFLGFQQQNSEPYLWAASTSGMTVFGVGISGWQPLWATDTADGYVYNSGNSTWTTSSSVGSLQATALISSMPVVVNDTLIVPAYVPPSTSAGSCGIQGSGYYDFFSLTTGSFPANTIVGSNGNYLTGDEYIGIGIAYSPTVAISSTGLPVLGGTQQTVTPSTPIVFSKTGVNAVVQWRVH